MTYSIGVDVGTTFTAAAVARDGRVEIVGLGNHSATIPTVVFLREDGELLVGDVAVRRAHAEPGRAAREFKRRFGDATPILLGHTPYSAERLTAAVLRHVIAHVAERQGAPADALAVVHPANWGPYKIELLGQAVQLAGAERARFVTEPEAAAMHYASSERVDVGDVVAVYDLGGGTFDAAVLRRTADGFETMGEPQGIERLGGIDFDEAVLSHVRTTLGAAAKAVDPSDPAVRSALSRLREECVAAKEALSDDSEVTIPVSLPTLHTDVRLTRGEFESVIRPALLETVHSLRRAIGSAGVAPGDISAVVLAGGSSRIPLVTELVSAELGRPVAVDAHPKHTVALGAASVAGGTDRPAGAPAPTPAPPVAVTPPAASTPDPVADQVAATPPTAVVPRVADAAGPPPPRRSRAKPLMLAAAAAVLVAGGVGVALALGGGDEEGDAADGSSTTAEPAVSAPSSTSDTGSGGAPPTVGEPDPATTTTVETPTCEAPTGRCVVMESIVAEGDDFVVTYSLIGYQPDIDGGPDSHHIHFFFDSLPLDQAGVPGGDGQWAVWDLDGFGQPIFRGDQRFRPSTVPAGATGICAVPATVGREVDLGAIPSCLPLPS